MSNILLDILDDVLFGADRDEHCTVAGCGKASMPSSRGNEGSYCERHDVLVAQAVRLVRN